MFERTLKKLNKILKSPDLFNWMYRSALHNVWRNDKHYFLWSAWKLTEATNWQGLHRLWSNRLNIFVKCFELQLLISSLIPTLWFYTLLPHFSSVLIGIHLDVHKLFFRQSKKQLLNETTLFLFRIKIIEIYSNDYTDFSMIHRILQPSPMLNFLSVAIKVRKNRTSVKLKKCQIWTAFYHTLLTLDCRHINT